jgi:hypothetical protein
MIMNLLERVVWCAARVEHEGQVPALRVGVPFGFPLNGGDQFISCGCDGVTPFDGTLAS